MARTVVRIKFNIITALLLSLPLWLGMAWADVVVMTTGERFTSSKVWQEGNKIRFNMQGLVVSVDKEEVAAIIQGDNDPPRPNPAPASSRVDPRPMVSSAPPAEYSPINDSTVKPRMRPRSTGRTTSADRSDHQPSNRKEGNKGLGMEGISWRMPPKQMPGLKKIETDPAFGGIDQYYQPDQALQFAGAPLDGLVYGFWQGQLYSVMMWSDGRSGYDRLRRNISSIYGHGIQHKPEVERYVWDEQTTQRMLEFDDQLNTGLFMMRSSELDALIKERYPVSSSR